MKCLMLIAIVLAAIAAPVRGGDDATPTKPAAPPEKESAPVVDPRAVELLAAAGKYLGDAKSLSFSADIWEDVVSSSGRKLQSQRSVDVGIRRPDRLVAHSRSERKSRDAYYDGKSLTIYNPVTRFYGVIADAPKTIDETIDLVSDRFAVSMPLSDLIVSDVNRDLLKNVRRGDYLGVQKVAGAPCHHLGFVQADIDWQIWIDADDRPLIRKILITYKNEDQAPQFVANLSKWNLDAALPDYAFQFRAPAGASKIDVLPAKAPPTTDPGPGEAGVAGQKQPPAGDRSKPSDSSTPERKE